MKRFLIPFIFFAGLHNLHAQADICAKVYVATTEKEMYQLIEMLIDSVVQTDYYSNHYSIYDTWDDFTAIYDNGDDNEIESTDTLMMAKEDVSLDIFGKPNFVNLYDVYLSSKMPHSFYEELHDYLVKLFRSDNVYIRNEADKVMSLVGSILVKRHKSGALSKTDRQKTKALIEQTILSSIIDCTNFNTVYYYYYYHHGKEFITKKIREALVEALESPYEPKYYVDFYLSRQDTGILDISDIPEEFIKNRPKPSTDEEYHYDFRLERFLRYKELAENKYGGISPGKAYLEERKNGYSDNGYMNINAIAWYAYNSQDKLVIKHLKKFKKKHPDYPLRYF